jgi:hypothetical protein
VSRCHASPFCSNTFCRTRFVSRNAGGLRACHCTDYVTNSRTTPNCDHLIVLSTCCDHRACVQSTVMVRRISTGAFPQVSISRASTQQHQFLALGAFLQLSHALTHQFLTLSNASIAWEYLIDDAKMGIFRAIDTGWVGGWMVSQFCYCSLTDARADGGIGPRYAGPPEYPDSEGPASRGPRSIIGPACQ